MSKRSARIAKYLCEHPNATGSQIREALQLSDVIGDLIRAEREGMIVSDKPYEGPWHYHLTKKALEQL